MKRRLSKQATILLGVGMLFTSGLVIASTFVNVYLIRLTNNMGLMILQNVVNYCFLLGAFLFGSVYVKRGSIVNLIRLGIISTVLYYSCILLLKEKASTYLIYLGAFNGIGAGLYYFAFNILVGKLTTDNERAKFFSYQQSFSYVFGIVAPSISGYVIAMFSELTGYYVLFGTSVFVFIIGIILSFLLNNVSTEKRYSVVPILKLKNNKYWNTSKYYNVTYGLREAIYGQIFTVFAYLIITTEKTVGQLGSIMSLIGVASSILIASKFTLKTQKKYQYVYSVGYFISLGMSAIFANKTMLIVTYILNGIIICWAMTIFSTMKYQLSNRASDEKHSSGDFIIACEFPMAVGRISGLLIFFVLNSFFGGFELYRFLLFAISLMPMLDSFIINKKINWLESES